MHAEADVRLGLAEKLKEAVRASIRWFPALNYDESFLRTRCHHYRHRRQLVSVAATLHTGLRRRRLLPAVARERHRHLHPRRRRHRRRHHRRRRRSAPLRKAPSISHRQLLRSGQLSLECA